MATQSDISKLQKGLLEATARAAREGRKAELRAANRSMAMLKTRVFKNGLSAENRLISSRYSSRPYYASIAGTKKRYGSQLPTSNLRPRGKSGAAKFRNGRIRKSMYLQDGYEEFRQVMGRQTGKVDLELTGDLRRSIKLVKGSNSTFVGIVDRENQIKAAALEDKYDVDVFALTDNEIKKVDDIMVNSIDNAILKALGF